MGGPDTTTTMSSGQNRRAERAWRARDTVTKVIPEILRASPRARHGVHRAHLVEDPPAANGRNPMHTMTTSTGLGFVPKIRVQCADTLTAARRMIEHPAVVRQADPMNAGANSPIPNVAILNMASPLRPGGGFLDGANSQEEFLCARTTLYASLRDSFYHLPEAGGVFTPDVMVFRDHTPGANPLSKRDRFFVDVISSGMLRFPDAQRSRLGERSASPPCSCGVSYCDRDRDTVTRKMKAVLRMAQQHGVRRLVLGAWGCGAYGNPVKEVAKIWRRVIAGSPRQRRPNAEQWTGLTDITFAIPDRSMAREFEAAFSDVLSRDGPSCAVTGDHGSGENTTSPRHSMRAVMEDERIESFISRIAETEMELEQTSNPRSKARLREVLGALHRDLTRGLAARQYKDDELTLARDEELEEDSAITGVLGSDGEGNNLYNFDEDDVASDSSEGAASEIYDFRSRSRSFGALSSSVHDPDDLEMRELYAVLPPSPSFNAATGWYTGSIDQFHKYMRGADATLSMEASPHSPMLHAGATGSVVADGGRLREHLDRYADETHDG